MPCQGGRCLETDASRRTIRADTGGGPATLIPALPAGGAVAMTAMVPGEAPRGCQSASASWRFRSALCSAKASVTSRSIP